MAGSISGKTFYDVNGNNVLDGGETGFTSVPVTLTNAAGATIASTMTDAQGQYSFAGLAAGTYIVNATAPSGQVPDNATPPSAVVSANGVTALDVGFYAPALIVGQIYNDLNRDGTWESNEAFMIGVKVNLLDMSGNIVATTTSATHPTFPGIYSFANLKPGSYQIQAVIPGEPLTQPLTPTGQLFGNQSLFNFNASAVTTPLAVGNGSIAGIAFLDTDANAAQDSGEAGMAGVAVTLKTEAGRTVAITTSDAQGHYSFGSLPDGDYKILFSATGFFADDGGPQSITVANQAVISGVNAGFFKPANISGVVSLVSTGASLDGVTVLLLDGAGKVVATTASGMATGPGSPFLDPGFYSFDNIKPGAYTVQAIIPNAVIPPAPSASMVLTSGQSTTSNIGIQSTAVSGIDVIFGTAFADIDGNGQQDSGEAALANLVVTVKDASGAAVGSAITDAQGHYRVNGLTDGRYSVSFGSPAGGLAITDVPVRMSAVQPFQLADGAFYSPATVSGLVFNDADSDGIAGSGEAGIAGVTVRLLGADGATVATTATGGNGGYTFTGVKPGGYFVQFVTPNGDVATTPNKIDLHQMSGGQSVTANAGFHAVTGQVSLSGTAFLDTNNNGVQDNGETGLAHVSAVLVNSAGVAVQTAVTDSSGHYSFGSVANGTYAVTFATPAGDVATTPTTVQAGLLAAGQAKTGLDAGFAPDPTPNNASGVPASTTLNIILRGQSNSQYFVQFGMLDKLKADIEAMLGFDGVHQKVNLLATMFQADGANTINSGTAVVGQWLVPIGGDYHNGWQATSLELGLLSAIARQPDDFKSGPTAVVWLHNETDTVNNPGMTPDQWESAARFEAGLVRGILGQSADTVPYLFVNAIPFPSNGTLNGTNPPPATTQADQAIRIGMAALAADPNFNGRIAAQSSDVNMDANLQGAYGGAHNDLSDAQQLEQRLARSLADTFSASAQPGSPLAQAGGHVDNLGPQVISAATVAGHDDQLLLTVQHDAAVTLEALGPGALQGLGWSMRDSAVGSNSALQASGVAVRIIDSTHLLVTFDNNVQTGSKLFYAWGSARIAPDGLPGTGNAVYDNNHLPIWTDPNGVGIINSLVAVSSTVSGTAFLDANGSHLPDNDEPGLGGLAVTLKDAFGATVGTTTTDQYGAYSFASVAPGTYSVTVAPPAPAFLSGGTENQTVIVGSNQNLSNINAGFYAPVMIFGLTFNDSAGIGQPTSAGFLNGIGVDLLNAAGTVVASTLTSNTNPLAPGQDGVYSFENFAPGSYSVRFIATAGNTVTTLAVNNLGTLKSGQQIEVDGGIAAAVGSIDGTVFTDNNGNNLLDGGEAVIAGDTVTLKNANGATVGTTTTDAQGHYNFAGLAAGVYTVNVTTPSGKLPDSATPLSVAVTTGAVTGQNVGFYTPAQIAGWVFNDANHNDTADNNEALLDGVTVNLLDTNGHVVATTVSAPLFGFPHGVYFFDSVKPGSYQIQLVVPGEALPQPLHATGALTGGQQLFGFYLSADITPRSITGSIFNDADHSGHQDASEGGFAGTAVMLVKDAGTPQAAVIAATTTDAQGHYTFGGVAAGTYTVISAAPSGDLPTTSQTLTVGPVAGGVTAHVDFGFAADPTPNAGPLPAVTTVNIIVRGQSNITYFTQDGYLAQLKTAIERALGFDGVHQVVNLLADNATLHPGTGLLRDWLSPVNGDYRNGWAANDIEKQFLSDVASQSAAFKSAPTLVLWLHNESDSLVPGVTTDEWMSAARFEAGLVRAALGQSADTVPYLFVNAIPFLQAGSITQAEHDNVQQNIKIGMATLAADPVFNARIVAQLSDVTMDRDGAINGAHLNVADNQQLLDRLSRSIPDVLAASAQPGSPLAQAGGHIASAGPQVISAAAMAGHPDQLLVTVQHDGSAGFATLDLDAAAGVGWSIRNNASGTDSVLEASATHVEIVDGTHLLITFDSTIRADGKLFYAWGANRLAATTALPGNGNAVYDSNNLPISADPNGVSVTGVAPPATGGSIAGTIFLDGNANNLLDGSDAGIASVTIVLKDANGVAIGTTASDSQGHYSFASLAAGTYTVNATTPSGKVADSATALSVTVTTGAVAGQNVGFFTPAVIAGFVFTDANGNGAMDGSETAVDGVTVNLLDSNGQLVASTVSAANAYFPHGVYEFDNVRPGTYTVQPIVTGAASHSTGSLTAGQALYGFHLGVPVVAPASTGTIFGFAFNDLNGNAQFDGGEALVNGETVELLNFNRDPVASTVTGPGAPLASISTLDGAYAFTNVTPGTYYLRFTAPDGKVLTTPVINSVGNLAGGQSVNVNSGVISSAGTITISGNAFDDTNSNGHRDSGEAGRAGVNVLLVKDAGTATAVAIKTAVTDADGHYNFNALPTGNYSVVFSTPSGLEGTSPTTISVGALVTGQSAAASTGFHVDLTPNAGPIPQTTVINVIVRGQSNAQNFSDPNFGNAVGAMKTQLEQLLGFDGVHQRVNIIADFGKPDGANTINSGTAMLTDWLSPIGGDYRNGWTAKNLELGLLSDLAQHAADLSAGPTAVIWLHNEHDSNNPAITTDMWTSAVRYEAGLVRGLLGQDAGSVPYLFVNAIPFPNSDNGDQTIKIGMTQLAADPVFNARIAAQLADIDETEFGTGPLGGHINNAERQLLAGRLAESLAQTFASSAMPGSPVALANGQVDDLGPHVIEARAVAGHTDQLLLTINHDAATGFEALDPDAAAGVGWSIRNSATGGSLQASGTAVQIVDSTHLMVTFDQNVPVNGKVFYAWGAGLIAQAGQGGFGNAIYDNNHMPIWTDPNGLGLAGAASVTGIATSGPGITNGDGLLKAGAVISFTTTFDTSVAVDTTHGAPTLTLSDGASATYASGSGTNHLVFTSIVGAGENSSDLAVTAFSLNGATVRDIGGADALLAGVVVNPAGLLVIDTTKPLISLSMPAAHVESTSLAGAAVGFSGLAQDNVAVTDAVVFKEGSTVVTSGQVFGIGAHTIVASVTDAAGNAANPVNFSFTVDPYVPPTVDHPDGPKVPQPPTPAISPLAELFDHFDQVGYVKLYAAVVAAHIDPVEYFVQQGYGNGGHAWLM